MAYIDDVTAEFRRMVDAKFTLYGYVKEMVLSRPGYCDGEHIHRMCSTIDSFLRDPDTRGLAISMPPRHMKSTIVSECLPAQVISNDHQREVVIASYNQSQARKMARACRQKFDEPYHIRVWGPSGFAVDTADEFQLTDKMNGRPNLIAAGVGAGLTGSGADLLIIDDPVKDMQEADSQTYRDRVYDWYASVAETRLSPHGKKLLVMTRWHHDDLAGRILNDDPDDWQVLNLPAISDDGTALWPERFSIEDLEKRRRSMGSRVFEALYQGRPTPLEGGLFKREWIRYGDPLGPDAVRVRYWDKAATAGGGDWTVGTLMATTGDGRFVIEDVIRTQSTSYDVQQLIRATAEKDGYDVRIVMEQEPGSSGVDVIDLYRRTILQGWDFRADKATGDKALRATGLSASMEGGNVSIVRAPWNREWIDEVAQFPLGLHDDQVDSASGAFRELTTRMVSTNVFFL